MQAFFLCSIVFSFVWWPVMMTWKEMVTITDYERATEYISLRYGTIDAIMRQKCDTWLLCNQNLLSNALDGLGLLALFTGVQQKVHHNYLGGKKHTICCLSDLTLYWASWSGNCARNYLAFSYWRVVCQTQRETHMACRCILWGTVLLLC